MPPTEPSSRGYRMPLTAIGVIAVLSALACAFAMSGLRPRPLSRCVTAARHFPAAGFTDSL